MNKTNGKVLTGKIKAIPTPKTVIVAVETFSAHPLYKKSVRKTRRFAAHTDSTSLTVGQVVNIGETKPLSKTKHFVVLEKGVKTV